MDNDAKPPRKLRPFRSTEQRLKSAPRGAGRAAAESSNSDHQRRLELLKRQIADGLYMPDPEAIAREMIRQGLDEA